MLTCGYFQAAKMHILEFTSQQLDVTTSRAWTGSWGGVLLQLKGEGFQF